MTEAGARARTPAISPVRRRSRPPSSAPSRAWCANAPADARPTPDRSSARPSRRSAAARRRSARAPATAGTRPVPEANGSIQPTATRDRRPDARPRRPAQAATTSVTRPKNIGAIAERPITAGGPALLRGVGDLDRLRARQRLRQREVVEVGDEQAGQRGQADDGEHAADVGELRGGAAGEVHEAERGGEQQHVAEVQQRRGDLGLPGMGGERVVIARPSWPRPPTAWRACRRG